jgi:hypothetical protein
MTTFRSQQSEDGRGIRQKAGTITFQIHVTNCVANLHCNVHEARKIVCNNFQRAAQERVIEWSFYAREALPLSWLRNLRLARSSPMTARSPARWQRDVRESSGKTAAGISCAMSAQFPGNGRSAAAATPPNVRQGGSRDNSHVDAWCPRRKFVRQLATRSRNSRDIIRATVKATSRKTTCLNPNHEIQTL